MSDLKKPLIVVQASDLLKQAANGDFSFDHAFDEIEKLDLKDFKKENETLTADISVMLFAGTDMEHVRVSSIGGNEVLIDKRAIDEFTKSRLLWKLKLKDIELNQIKEMILAYEGALEKYGHFDDKEKES